MRTFKRIWVLSLFRRAVLGSRTDSCNITIMLLLSRVVRLLGRERTMLYDQCISANMSSASSSKRLRVLVDMDGVIADFEGGFLKNYRARYPNDPFITLEDRRGFWVSSQYGQLRSDLCVSGSQWPIGGSAKWATCIQIDLNRQVEMAWSKVGLLYRFHFCRSY